MKILKIPYISKRYKINEILRVQVDDDMLEKYKDKKFHVVHKVGTKGYYFSFRKDGSYVYLHRDIINCPNRLQTDHIDRNTLNCQKKNLRVATIANNAANKSSSGKYRGVAKSKTGKYYVNVCKDGKVFTSRYYDSEKEAAKVYNRLATFVHGEYATINKM